jgi:hypothetical protein
MNDLRIEEYRALRGTIQARGTARTCIFIAGLGIWAALSLVILGVGIAPLAVVFPLLVLAGTFEAVFALHAGVERIGRYLQVFHGDTWEQAAMAFGPPLAGTGTDPLFAGLFGLATVCNFVQVLVAGAVPAELAVLGGFHMVFLARVVMARRAAARQRAADLARFEQLKQTDHR